MMRSGAGVVRNLLQRTANSTAAAGGSVSFSSSSSSGRTSLVARSLGTASSRQTWDRLSSNFLRKKKMKKTSVSAASPPPTPSLSSSTRQGVRSLATSSGESAMKDEYGAMDDSGSTYRYPGEYVLESGQTLPVCELRYQTYGELNAARDNCLVICHALTGNASLHAWWGDLLGERRPFDTDKYFVVCCNILGSCYGSTSPTSIDPASGQPYSTNFPDVSVKDTVRLQLLLLQNELGVKSVKSVIGGSFGGMQVLEFAVQAGSSSNGNDGGTGYCEFTDAEGNPYVRTVIPIACGARHTAWQIAISEVQRQAIYHDPEWQNGTPEHATNGLQVARQLGMVSYRTPVGYCQKFGRNKQTDDSPEYGSAATWQVKNYLKYQGVKFLSRFDPVTYVKLTEQMDSHDVARGRGGDVAAVLRRVTIPAAVLGIDSDVLYPLREQQELVDLLPNASLHLIHSDDGHDGFLLEQEQVGAHITDFLEKHGG